MKKILVTGGAGFIGSALIRYLLSHQDVKIINVDKLTYAGNLSTLTSVSDSPNYCFEKVDICDRAEMERIFEQHQPDGVMHLAAESHVDRSIDGPGEFIQTNVFGTYNLLEVAKNYWLTLAENKKSSFRFHHISTDEVYGDLPNKELLFTETTRYDPSSPYSASKAASDHLVRAWNRTFGLPVLVTNCSNNYGPFHFPEKLIPLMILNALEGKTLPVYGDGTQVRDWLFVDDHAKALYMVIIGGKIGETYNIGGYNEKTNIEVVETICNILDEKVADKPNGISTFKELITFVDDRPGHDLRYAIDAQKVTNELGWMPDETFDSGIRKTVEWYLAHLGWCREVQDENYQRQRIGKLNK